MDNSALTHEVEAQIVWFTSEVSTKTYKTLLPHQVNAFRQIAQANGMVEGTDYAIYYRKGFVQASKPTNRVTKLIHNLLF